MARLALPFAAGAALPLSGAPLPPAPFLVALLLAPIAPFLRPGPAAPTRRRLVLLLAFGAGAAHGVRAVGARAADCRPDLAEGFRLELSGPVESVGPGTRGALRVRRGLPPGCRGTVRLRFSGPEDAVSPRPAPGDGIRVRGRWRRWPGARTPDAAGELLVDGWEAAGGGAALLRWRGVLARAVERRFPEHHGTVAALVLARREGLDPDLREAFARTGTAHLLAISGFHVGVVAALLAALLRGAGLGRERTAACATGGVWAYVALVGFPDAAVRAALLLSAAAVGRLRGRPVEPVGGLAAALLLALWVRPDAVGRPGFQLSFAGAAGLAVWAAPLEAGLRRAAGRLVPPGVGAGGWSGWSAVAAGVAATAATLPVVAWHFGRVSLLGIPATLAATPAVAAAIPGVFAALLLGAVSEAAGDAAAGGVALLLDLLAAVVGAGAALPWASVDVARSLVVAAGGGAGLALALLAAARGVGGAARGWVVTGAAACGLLLHPLARGVALRGTAEIVVLDVGQGDAIAVRTPGDRWLLVDAGPPDAARGPLVRRLRALGARRLELLALTHPDLDHVGGAAALLTDMEVGWVLDPGHVRGSGPYRAVLRAAADGGLPWRRARAGDRVELDGLVVDVLAPLAPGVEGAEEADTGPGTDSNAASLVLLVRWGGVRVLLTGDAPAAVEDAVAGRAAPVDVLKVSHHGSATGTTARFLDRTAPSAALVSVGRFNRFGHPDPGVLARLEDRGVRLHRTDRDGTLRLVLEGGGAWRVVAER